MQKSRKQSNCKSNGNDILVFHKGMPYFIWQNELADEQCPTVNAWVLNGKYNSVNFCLYCEPEKDNLVQRKRNRLYDEIRFITSTCSSPYRDPPIHHCPQGSYSPHLCTGQVRRTELKLDI